MHIFTELVGIQMLLMNALEPLLRGEKMPKNNSPSSFAKSRRPRPRRPRNSSPSAARTRRNDYGDRSTMGTQRVDYLAATRYVYTLGAFIFALVATGFFVYIRFQFGLSPLERYYLPYYLRTETAGLTHPVSNYQLLYVSDGEVDVPGQRLNPMYSRDQHRN